jgi:WD40 repeat protein
MAYFFSNKIILIIALIFLQQQENTDLSINTLIAHSAGVNSIDLSPKGDLLISGSKDETVCIWDLKHNKLVNTIPFAGTSVKRVSFNSDGTKFLAGLYEKFAEVEIATLKKRFPNKKAHTSFVETCNYSKDNQLIATSSWRDKSLIIWGANNLKKEIILNETDIWVNNAIFNKNASLLFSAGHDNLIKVWNTKNGGLIKSMAGHDDWVYDLCLSDDENTLYSGGFDKLIKVWDIKSGKNLNTLKGHSQGVVCIDLSPNNLFLASGSADSTIIIWDLKNKIEIQRLRGHQGIVMDVKFSLDSKTLYSCSLDKTIKIWDLGL